MKPIKKIVVGTDFSEQSLLAAKQALALARKSGASLTIAYVGTVIEADAIAQTIPALVQEYEKAQKERLADSRAKLADFRDQLEGQGVDIGTAVYDGFPETGLVALAGEIDADLVVVGSHGRSGWSRMVLGSVAERVVRYSPRHVLVARGHSLSNGAHRILVPTDFSVRANEALAVAASLVQSGGHIDLVHAWGNTLKVIDAVDELMINAKEELQRAGQELVNDHKSDDYTIDFILEDKTPNPGILHAAEANDYDMVCMSSHGRKGLKRWILGSIAEKVVRHAPCSVLVVHRPEEQK